MKPWREVLAERGWEPSLPARDGVVYTWGEDKFRIAMARGEGADSFHVRLQAGRFWFDPELQSAEGADPDAAFAALMAKPVGPGRVTVGVLLGVSE